MSMRLAVIILNYRRAALTIGCLEALEPEISPHADRCAIVIDNGSDDDSVSEIQRTIDQRQWGRWINFIRSPKNLGFAGGNNLGFRTTDSQYYMLLNSDARVTSGSLDELLRAMDEHEQVGAIGPRLQGPDGESQCSCFRYRTPLTEFLDAAATGPLDRLFRSRLVAMGVFDQPMQPQWLSFACIMLRGSMIRQIGPMDERYFMYFEDIDYSRKIRKAGWAILHWPAARVIHIRGGTSAVKAAIKARARVPRYYYESRSRYFAKFYGGVIGLWFTNLLWLLGRTISFTRETLGSKSRSACALEAIDNWTNWLRPLSAPQTQRGGEL